MRETNSTLQATASIRRLKYHTFFGRHFRHRFCIVSRIVLFFVFAKYVFISYLLSFGIKCHLHLVLPKRTEQSFAFEKCTKLFSSVFSEHKMEHAQWIRWMIHMHSRFYVKCWHFLLGKKNSHLSWSICLRQSVQNFRVSIFANSPLIWYLIRKHLRNGHWPVYQFDRIEPKILSISNWITATYIFRLSRHSKKKKR